MDSVEVFAAEVRLAEGRDLAELVELADPMVCWLPSTTELWEGCLPLDIPMPTRHLVGLALTLLERRAVLLLVQCDVGLGGAVLRSDGAGGGATQTLESSALGDMLLCADSLRDCAWSPHDPLTGDSYLTGAVCSPLAQG